MVRSKFLKLNLLDFGKGLLVAVIAAVITLLYEVIQVGGDLFAPGQLKVIGLTALAAALAYILKNLFTNSEGEPLKLEK